MRKEFMHELGIVYSIAQTVEEFAKENGVKKIDTIVLEVGAIASVVPDYLMECYPAAIDENELLHDTKLRIDIAPAYVKCRECGEIYDVVKADRICPKCGKMDYEILSGTEFFIKEIVVPDDEYDSHEYDDYGNLVGCENDEKED